MAVSWRSGRSSWPARRAKVLRPDLKVLLSSGYVGEAVSMAPDSFDLIDKPYERSTLAARLAQLLGPSGRGKRKASSGGRGRASSAADSGPREGRRATVS